MQRALLHRQVPRPRTIAANAKRARHGYEPIPARAWSVEGARRSERVVRKGCNRRAKDPA
eukprot:1681143-Prymnesium_polylepis.1